MLSQASALLYMLSMGTVAQGLNQNFTTKKMNDWEVIYPGPESGTGCARGSRYAFYYRPGKGINATNLVIEFQAGGGIFLKYKNDTKQGWRDQKLAYFVV